MTGPNIDNSNKSFALFYSNTPEIRIVSKNHAAL